MSDVPVPGSVTPTAIVTLHPQEREVRIVDAVASWLFHFENPDRRWDDVKHEPAKNAYRRQVRRAMDGLVSFLDGPEPVLADALRYGLVRDGQIELNPEAVVPLVHVRYPEGWTT
jgi:hypothetical protein